MRRIVAFVCVVVVVGVVGLAPAGADIDKNPNALPFGPAECEDGRTFDNLYSPGGVVGQQVGTNLMGTNHRIWIASAEGDKVLALDDPLSPGLARLTVFCWWEDPNSFTGYVGGDILFGGHGRP